MHVLLGMRPLECVCAWVWVGAFVCVGVSVCRCVGARRVLAVASVCVLCERGLNACRVYASSVDATERRRVL
jgi:hypothetical protein